MSTYKNYPLLITRGVHVFPKCMSGMDVGRPFSLMAISHAFAQFNGDIILVSQMDAQKNEDLIDNIYEEGTLCHIDSTKDTRGILKIRLTGIEHVAISNVRLEGEADKEFYVCNASTRKVVLDCSIDEEKKLISELGAILATTPLENSIPRPILYKLQKGISSEELTDQLANYLPLDYSSRQLLLEEVNISKRLNLLIEFLGNQKVKDEVEREIQKKVNSRAEQNQKEYFLREKMRAIQEELDEMKGEESENDKILKKIEAGHYPSHVADKIKKELKRFEQLPGGSLESSMAKTYIDWLVDLH